MFILPLIETILLHIKSALSKLYKMKKIIILELCFFLFLKIEISRVGSNNRERN